MKAFGVSIQLLAPFPLMGKSSKPFAKHIYGVLFLRVWAGSHEKVLLCHECVGKWRNECVSGEILLGKYVVNYRNTTTTCDGLQREQG